MFSSFIRDCILVIFVATIPCECWARCRTPNGWLGIRSNGTAGINYSRSKLRWTDGIVYFYLNKSLSHEDIIMIHQSFSEFHKKTCIRFQEKSNFNLNFVSIEFDPLLNGALAEVCMKGGYQFLRFGPGFRNKETIIHELGHTLCLGHEHQRQDRDDYVFVNKDCGDEYYEKFKNRPVRGLYDYASQMHYMCDAECLVPKSSGVSKCGEQVNKGLSVLDADYINELYSCQGCFGHRWLPSDIKNVNSYNFRYNQRACRALVNGEILIGTYKSNLCWIHCYNNSVHVARNGFENLHISWIHVDKNYFFVNMDSDSLSKFETKKLLTNAVPGGYHLNSRFGYKTTYVGYAITRKLDKWLNVEQQESKDLIGTETEEIVFGPVWEEGGKLVNIFGVAGKSFRLQSYKILVCHQDSSLTTLNLKPLNNQTNGVSLIEFTEQNQVCVKMHVEYLLAVAVVLILVNTLFVIVVSKILIMSKFRYLEQNNASNRAI